MDNVVPVGEEICMEEKKMKKQLLQVPGFQKFGLSAVVTQIQERFLYV